MEYFASPDVSWYRIIYFQALIVVPVFLMEATAIDFVRLKKNLGSKLSEVVIPNISIARTEVKTAFTL